MEKITKEMHSKRVFLVRYKEGNLYYRTEHNFEFPVPIDETGNGSFETEDTDTLFIKWIRRHLASRGIPLRWYERTIL